MPGLFEIGSINRINVTSFDCIDTYYSDFQNNVELQPPANLVKVGKNSQIKARKSEHGYNFKNRVRQDDFILQMEAL